MDQEAIFAPMGALAFVTFTVLSLVPLRRFRAAFAGHVTVDDFALGESARVPGHVSLANRNYMNLIEAPVLFYIGGLMYFVAGRLTETALMVAWAYVALRAAHSLVHVTYNNVMHRLVLFAISNFVLLAFWVLFFIHP